MGSCQLLGEISFHIVHGDLRVPWNGTTASGCLAFTMSSVNAHTKASNRSGDAESGVQMQS